MSFDALLFCPAIILPALLYEINRTKQCLPEKSKSDFIPITLCPCLLYPLPPQFPVSVVMFSKVECSFFNQPGS